MEYFTAYKKPPHIPALGRSWKALRECERPFDSRYSISFWYTFGNEPLSLTVFEIFASKYIWHTTLTFFGARDGIRHMTICKPYRCFSRFQANGPQICPNILGHDLDLSGSHDIIDLSYVISCWWFTGTKLALPPFQPFSRYLAQQMLTNERTNQPTNKHDGLQ